MARRHGKQDREMRHGSGASTNGSRRSSNDTVKGRGQRDVARPGTPSEPEKDRLHSSPHDNASTTSFLSSSPDLSPTDKRSSNSFRRHKKARSLVGTDHDSLSSPLTGTRPTPSGSTPVEGQPSAAPVDRAPLNTSRGTFYHDQDQSETEATPTRPPSASDNPPSDESSPGPTYEEFLRRPSVASAGTFGSRASRSTDGSGRYQKRLQGFFGEEFQGPDSQPPPLPQPPSPASSSAAKPKERSRSPRIGVPSFNGNRAGGRGRKSSSSSPTIVAGADPGSSRPLTPLPPSNVTPWEYQNFTDIPNLGEAPIRQTPVDLESSRPPPSRPRHRLYLPGHRYSRSKEDKARQSTPNLPYSIRPRSARDDLNPAIAKLKDPMLSPAAGSSTISTRATSPTPSSQSAGSKDAPQSPGPAPKRSLLDRIRRSHRHHHLRPLQQSAKSSQDQLRGAGSKLARPEASPVGTGRSSSFEVPPLGRPWDGGDSDRDRDRKKEHGKGLGIGGGKFLHGRRPFGGGHGSDADKNRRPTTFDEDRVFALDTNLGDMSGIVSEVPPPLAPADAGGIFTGSEPLGGGPNGAGGGDRDDRGLLGGVSHKGYWHAPESWVVKRPGDEIVRRLPEIPDEESAMSVDEDGHPYCVRIFRIDSTFATLSSGLNTTVTDILEMLGRKSFLQDDLNNYDIVMRKNDLSRTLEHGERPILMQKKLLQQAGYQESDRIADIGREDNSYLVRFTFLPTKLTGYSSLDSDPGFNRFQKFTHVDLQGRSLVTIPLMLYSRASEIVSLNLSRNLALDVPKDFIQSCTNLREIKYAGNEAWRLPASFSLASRLTLLDISNNRLVQLEHAELHRLSGLVSLKMANNTLSYLPEYFGAFSALRSLNISSNNFEAFPEFLCNLKSLVDLDISFNKISSLPNIGKLSTLERLWVTNNLLSGPLDETFQHLVNLKEIDARFNNITDISILTKLPRLENLLVGHNAVSTFAGSFQRLRNFVLDHCPVTEFDLTAPVPTLTYLNIASAKLVQFKDTLFDNMPNLVKLVLNKNHFVTLSPYIGNLRRLEHFSMAKNPLSSLPETIGCLTELKSLNLRECNLNKLPPEIWYCLKLENLNVSSNLLDGFPKPASSPPQPPSDSQATPVSTPGVSSTPTLDEMGKLEQFEARRPSQSSSNYLGVSSHDGRKGSGGSAGRKASVASRTTTDSSRKDSIFSQRLANTFAGSLRHLYLADNRLEDDIFNNLVLLPELRVLNLSYNALTEIPIGLLKRWQNLTELYLSGNGISALPSDDLEESCNLRVLHVNANKIQVLPAELCKVNKLAVLDVGSNTLKYNVSNWPYDWNWNWNHNLRYLNFSGNKRFEIKPNISYPGSAVQSAAGTDLTSFNSLKHIRVLGLMDVTLTIPTIPDQTEDRRVRTAASLAGSISYGMADTLGRTEHLSMIDMVIPKFQGNEMETVIGLFDGQASSLSGSKVAKFLQENFASTFIDELGRLRTNKPETPCDALRRTFLALNKELATAANKSMDDRQRSRATGVAKLLNKDDLTTGGVATILYLQNMDLHVANVGDAQAVLVQSSGGFKYLTEKHNPAEASERERIRAAGGFVSRNGKLNDQLTVSRAFGYFHMMPAVMAAPSTSKVTLSAQDEMIILATGELWEYVTPDVVVDVARAERGDLMVASQKIRDLAISYGATNKIMVMIAGVSDLKRRERNKFRGASLSMGPSAFADEHFLPTKRIKRPRDAPSDSRLARLDHVEPPTGELAIIFTDIRKSTSLWESYPVAMRSAIQIHNDLFRRQLGIIGGYEVKTEGDAFMVSFSTPTAALLWCFTCQSQLLDAPWPREILDTAACREQYDPDGNLIYRGLSVRMGVHWGRPVCEKDPVTGRMDYFGPMVNRASRISAVADGGQIFVSSDFVAEIQRMLEAYADSDRGSSTGSEDTYHDDVMDANIRRELYQLSTQGFEVKDLGERKLKGLENPELVYLMYPHSLAGRLLVQPEMTEEGELIVPPALGKDSKFNIEADDFWRLMKVALRLEAFCSAMENPDAVMMKEPEFRLLNALKASGGDITDEVLLNLFEHQVARIEMCVNTLTIRNMMRPFKRGDKLSDHAVPMAELLEQLQAQMAEFRALKENINVNDAGRSSRPSPVRTLTAESRDAAPFSSSYAGSEVVENNYDRDSI
ncbi:hypothetical protein VTO42DRAFT_7062 [Malbranchea cinnamomea]